MKIVTINAPAQQYGKKQYIEVSGSIVHLYVGAYRHKFLLQETATHEVFLTHYASGMRLGSLTPIKLANFKSYARLPNREAAKLLIEKLTAIHGADAVNEKLNGATVIN